MYTHQTIAEFSYRYGEVFPPSLLASKWEDLTLADYVVFGTVMLRPDLCKRLIELALQIPIDHIEYVEREKDLRAMPGTHGVRLDVYVDDGTGRCLMLSFSEEMRSTCLSVHGTTKRAFATRWPRLRDVRQPTKVAALRGENATGASKNHT